MISIVSGADFDRIYSLIEIHGVLVNETPLRIGTGKESEKRVDQLIIKVNGKPIIPGSSLKGALRSFAEKIARTSGYKVCDPFSKKDKEWEEKNGPCIICQIFGGGGARKNRLASHIIFFDALPKDFKIGYITRVGIDRFRGGARSGALFRTEYVEPNSRWEFKVKIYNLDMIDKNKPPGLNDEEYYSKVELIRQVFLTLSKYGMFIGGNRSIGYGLVKLLPDETRVIKYTIKNLKITKQSEYILKKLVEEWSNDG